MKTKLGCILAVLAVSVVIIAACSSGEDTCEGGGQRICLVPLGRVSGDLVDHLVNHYRDEYGLKIRVLDDKPIPTELSNTDRQQVGAIALIEYMGRLFPQAYADPDAILIGLTPADIYLETRDWRFAFGTWGSAENPKGIVSFFRMDPRRFGEPRNDDLLFTRVRKMVTRYIGMFYYDLPLDSNPRSLLYDNILSLEDLDTMQEPLPVATGR